MTVHFFNAYFADESGKEFYGTVYWDKYYQRKLKAELYPRTGPNECGYPIWTAWGHGTDLKWTERMVAKLKAKATELDLSLTSEKLTQFAPKEGD